MSASHPSDAGAVDDLLAAFQLAVIKANAAQNAVEWDEALISRTAKERSILRNDLRARLLAARSPAPSDERFDAELRELEAAADAIVPAAPGEGARDADDCGLEQWIESKAGHLLGETSLLELDAIVAKIRARSSPPDPSRDAPLIDAEQEAMIQNYATLPPLTVLPQTVRDASFLARLVLLQRAARSSVESPTETQKSPPTETQEKT